MEPSWQPYPHFPDAPHFPPTGVVIALSLGNERIRAFHHRDFRLEISEPVEVDDQNGRHLEDCLRGKFVDSRKVQTWATAKVLPLRRAK